MRFSIHECEILTSSFKYQIILNILKEKGAQIKNHFNLDVDPEYLVKSYYDQHLLSFIFDFEKKQTK